MPKFIMTEKYRGFKKTMVWYCWWKNEFVIAPRVGWGIRYAHGFCMQTVANIGVRLGEKIILPDIW